jgi:hypothetical protein
MKEVNVMYIHQAKQFSMVILTVIFLLGAGMAEAQKVRVTEAVPSESEEDVTHLVVEISGGGFDAESEATFLVANSTNDKGGITVHSTGLINSKKVIADITIPLGATLGDYDIEVTASRGRRGKGNTLFHVLQKSHGGDNNAKTFPVKVTFDDADGDTIRSDGNADYVSDSGANADSGVGAVMPVEFSPPGHFLFVHRSQGDRSLFIDFGAAVDCATGAPNNPVTDACVKNNAGMAVLCPFPSGERKPDASKCSGLKRVVMGFRHSVDESGAELEYMLGMEEGVTFDGESDGIEIDLREERNKDDDLRLRFDANCLGEDKGDFLKITAYNNVVGDGIPNDEWKIDTIETEVNGDGLEVITSTTKTACLTRKGKGKNEYLIGEFDMQFGYTICILADPAVAGGECL